MRQLRTAQCSRHRHPEFRIAYSASILEEDAAWFIQWLEESVAAGARFKPGETCQVGWIVTEVRQDQGGDLTLWEPDMRSFPVNWQPEVSHTLAHLRVQKDVVESVFDSDALSFPSLVQSAIVCTRLGKTPAVVMERTEGEGTDSGWFCGCRDDGHDHNDPKQLRCISLYEAVVKHAPQIIPYLALPVGVLAEIGAGAPTLYYEGDEVEFQPGSYLAERYPE